MKERKRLASALSPSMSLTHNDFQELMLGPGIFADENSKTYTIAITIFSVSESISFIAYAIAMFFNLASPKFRRLFHLFLVPYSAALSSKCQK